MPLVFVHGVATRQTPAYKAEVAQRDLLFKRLVVGQSDPVFDPDWGSHAVSFARGGWVPVKGETEAFNFGAAPLPPGGPSVAAAVAPRSLEQAVDLAFGALLASKVADGAALGPEQLNAFDAAVRYLEGPADPSAFAPTETDAQFAQSLEAELRPLLTPTEVEGMGLGDVFTAIGKALKVVTDPLRNAGSDAVLQLIRAPLSNQVGLFLGDVFVYLRWRETDGATGTYNRIFEPIILDLAAANVAMKPDGKLIVVGHSLGGVILYDLLTDPRALGEIENRSGRPLQVDAWITVGAQPGLFADMGLYDHAPDANGKLVKPECVARWMNVFDFTDVFSFRTEPFFSGVVDYEFDNVSGALDAHTAYFQRPSFYKRLRARLGAP